MAENKDKLLLTYKHLRCNPEARKRKRGTHGLTNVINTHKIGCFLPYFSDRVQTILRGLSQARASSSSCASSWNSQAPEPGPQQKKQELLVH